MAHRLQSRAVTDESPTAGPVRTCIGCRQRAARSELLRVTAGSDRDGHPIVRPDPEGTTHGRGAHLHPTAACYDLAVRRKAFARALRFTQDGAALSSAPLADYLTRIRTDPTDRDWSSSS